MQRRSWRCLRRCPRERKLLFWRQRPEVGQTVTAGDAKTAFVHLENLRASNKFLRFIPCLTVLACLPKYIAPRKVQPNCACLLVVMFDNTCIFSILDVVVLDTYRVPMLLSFHFFKLQAFLKYRKSGKSLKDISHLIRNSTTECFTILTRQDSCPSCTLSAASLYKFGIPWYKMDT